MADKTVLVPIRILRSCVFSFLFSDVVSYEVYIVSEVERGDGENRKSKH